MINAIVIDDEPIALEVVKRHAERIPHLRLMASFTNAFDGLSYLSQHQVDLIFLDINMPDISGLELLQSMEETPEVIFTTAHAEFAVASYDFQAVDYLLKPFEFGRFLKAVNRALLKLGKPKNDHIFIKSGFDHIRLDNEQIVFLKAEGNYVKFICTEGQYMARMKISEAEELLDQDIFLRTHRSFMVNKHKITKVERHQVSLGKELVPISQSYYDELIQRL